MNRNKKSVPAEAGSGGLPALAGLADSTLIVVAVTYGWLLALAGAAGLLGLPLRWLLVLSLGRYAYEVARRGAQGRRETPAPGLETMSPFGNFGLVLHFALFAGLAVLLARTPLIDESPAGSLFRSIALTGVFVAFPASAALMALTTDLAAALDPRRIATLIAVLGARRYAAMLLIGGAFVLCVAELSTLPWPAMDALLFSPLRVWTVLAVFSAIGTMLRARRDVLEIAGESVPDAERAEHARRDDWQKQLDLAYASIRSGLVTEGYRTIHAMAAEAGMSDAVYVWLLDRMFLWEDKTHALALAAHYIELLVENGRPHPALELAARCHADGALPMAPGTCAALADYARSIGRHALADRLATSSR